MTDKNNLQKEQRAYYIVCILVGFAVPDIKSDLDKVYGDSALSYATYIEILNKNHKSNE